MSERDLETRRKRVNRLKRLIILLLIISIAVPVILCILLFFRVGSLERNLEDMQMQMEELSETIREQAETEASEEANAAAQVPMTDIQQPGAQPEEQGETPEEPEEHVRKVYLTFDDGPSSNTNQILDILKEYDVKATFFVVGKEDERSKEALKRIVAEGHTLGMHSYSHEYKDIYASVDAFTQDFHKLQDYLYRVTEVRSNFYRFPGGSSNTISDVDMREFAGWLSQQGISYFDWNVSSGDAAPKQPSPEAIVENCMKDLERHDTVVILMHDAAGKKNTVEALPMLLDKILALDDTVILPITEETRLVQHITIKEETED